MARIGLIGGDLSYTESPRIYKKLLQKDFEFIPFEINPDDSIPSLNSFFEKADFFAVTNPYKRSFLNEIDVIDNSVTLTSNLNNIYKKDGLIHGHNTDYLGFERLLLDQFSSNNFKVILLGDGNLSMSVAQALNKNKFVYDQFSRRNDSLNQTALSNEINQIRRMDNLIPLIINTCSREFIFNFELDYSGIYFWDLNYGISEHDKVLSQKVKVYQNGLTLLEEQAKCNITIWNL